MSDDVPEEGIHVTPRSDETFTPPSAVPATRVIPRQARETTFRLERPVLRAVRVAPVSAVAKTPPAVPT